jgi:mRNA-degrading endonuclease RelE of RelBE toxin-antitoxin system
MRTTLDIDDPILKDLKRLQKRERKTLGRLVSDLLALALRQHDARSPEPAAFRWIARPMGSRIDLSDREAIFTALSEPSPDRRRGKSGR